MRTNSIAVAVSLAVSFFLLTALDAGAAGYTLTLHAQGSGTVVPDNTNNPLPAGVVITITATASPGWYFANWTGDASGKVNPLQVTMNSNKVITGNFLAYPTYALTLTTNGQGSIDLNPAGGSYQSNTVVIATATPASGWVFAGWSGSAFCSDNPYSVTLDTNVSLTGTFVQLPAFDTQPVSVTNKNGSTVSFFGHAVGTAPLNYQWYFSGGSLSANAINTTLSLTNISSDNVGNYWLVATNTYGSATSHLASLTLTNSGPTNIVKTPDEPSLLGAIKIGGWIGLAFNGTLTLTNPITITNHVILDGNNVTATINGGNAVRLFYVAPGASLTASNLVFANGASIVTSGAPGTPADAGAIYNSGGSVTLVDCTLTNNTAESLIFGGLARGGAIFNDGGTVSLIQSGVFNNTVVGGGTNSPTSGSTIGTGLGGAIYGTNGATLVISGCSFGQNQCASVCASAGTPGTGLAIGGAVFCASCSATITDSSFTSNSVIGGIGIRVLYFPPGMGTPSLGSPAFGGAMAILGGHASISRGQFIGNTTQGGDGNDAGSAGAASGGAIYSTATLTVEDSSFLGNRSFAGNNTAIGYGASKGLDGVGGVIYNAGVATLNRCSVYSNSVQGGSLSQVGQSYYGGNGLGGGIFNAAQLAATNCTIAFNSATAGPGASTVGSISGNAFGGGVFNNANATFIAMNLTIASNSCVSPTSIFNIRGVTGGFQIANTNGTLRLRNSILAGAPNPYGVSDAYGTITDAGYNICSDASASLFSGSSYNNSDPKLATLSNYGGPTLCMALQAISPAIDFGGAAGAPNTDQRGYARPFGDGPDIGAFEYGSAPLVTPILNLISSSSTNIVLSFAAEPPGSYRLQCSTNLLTWSDLNTNGPFASSTNVTQSVAKQGFQSRYFRLLMQ